MAQVDEATLGHIRERLAGSLVGPVELRLFSGLGGATCDAAEELAQVLVESAPDKISLTVMDVSGSSDPWTDVPVITVGRPGENARVAFQGLPGGYEFATLLDAVERVSVASPDLSPDLVAELVRLDQDVEVMVFVTPTCPYCPGAASIANRMAVASPRVHSVVVEANEFDELSRRFEVQGVPQSVVNRAGSFVGALPEKRFVQSVLHLAQVSAAGGELR